MTGLALLCTVALMVWMGFFMMGSLPLLVLAHDTPLDGRFIRGLFAVYYMAVICTSAAGLPFHALAGFHGLALGFACVLVLAFASRRVVLARMDRLRAAIQDGDSSAIRGFRKIHIAGMLLNVVQLAGVAWGLARLGIR